MDGQKILMNVREAKEMLGGNVSLPALYAWTEIEGFPMVKIGRKKLIHVEGFKKWVSEQTKVGK